MTLGKVYVPKHGEEALEWKKRKEYNFCKTIRLEGHVNIVHIYMKFLGFAIFAIYDQPYIKMVKSREIPFIEIERDG